MSLRQVIEKRQEVTIPNVGIFLRVEQLSPDGELLGVEYRRPTDPKPAPVDHASTFVVFVMATATQPFVLA